MEHDGSTRVDVEGPCYLQCYQTYAAMTEAATVGPNNDLRDYDSGLSTDVTVAGTAPTATSYCLQSTHGGFTYHIAGPGGTILPNACP